MRVRLNLLEEHHKRECNSNIVLGVGDIDEEQDSSEIILGIKVGSLHINLYMVKQ